MKYDERQKFEHELINRRVTWLLSSQSLLFAALALSYNKAGDLTIIISWLGAILSLLIFLGILMGVRAKFLNFKREKEKQKLNPIGEYETNPLQWGVKTSITGLSILPDMLMPMVFTTAWIIILCIAYSR